MLLVRQKESEGGQRLWLRELELEQEPFACVLVLLTADMVYSCVCERQGRKKKEGFHSFT